MITNCISDETTTNLWDMRKRIWQHKKDKIICKLPSSRGSNVTIFGALSSNGDLFYTTAPTTNKETALEFLQSMNANRSIRGKVMVLDNHRAHYSYYFRDYAEENGMNLLFLPPGSSQLNPIETVWSMVKA